MLDFLISTINLCWLIQLHFGIFFWLAGIVGAHPTLFFAYHTRDKNNEAWMENLAGRMTAA